ncbi:Tat pathway signal sequence domain protein [Streptomyces sp. NPDC090025]|uniref:Tat pathway signal sequence domain protein n=1 Tax=Streptomyces sp. NPDC090025 TaxID=3365922 RepID=UPI0038341AA7
MYEIVRRHLGKVVAGAAMAVTGTAVAVAVTLPGSAGADEAPRTAASGAGSAGTGTAATGGQGGPGAEGQAPGPAALASAPPEGAKGIGTDPLTDDELRRAETLAFTPPAAAAQRDAQRDAEGGRGPQHLGTELADPRPGEETGGPRRAVVRFYDYRRDELLTRTVNLDTGKVEQSGAQRGVQPSAHPEELKAALKLILADPLGKDVKADYKDATGRDLTGPEQLWFNGDLYRTYREQRVPAALAKCGEHRCVRLVTKVLNGPWIDTRGLIVDLSARTVTRVG